MTRRPWHSWVIWSAVLLAVTVAILLASAFLEKAHIALLFLLVVLGGSAAGGRSLGVALSIGSFFIFNFFFLPPYRSLAIANPLDWLVLAVFLVTGIFAAHLLYRIQAEATAAKLRADELDRLASLGAETLNVARSEEALTAVARVIRNTLGVSACDVFKVDSNSGTVSPATAPVSGALSNLRDESTGIVGWVGRNRRSAAQLADGTVHIESDSAEPVLAQARGARIFALPLDAGGRTVGVMRLADPAGIDLDPAKRRFLEALSYYAALGVERVRLSADAEKSAALAEADRMKDALLASVSHDIRTPLTTIRALAHDIAADGDERALVIEEEALRLNRFVGNLLDLSRLSAGTIPLSVEINVAEDLIGAALQRMVGISGHERIAASIDPQQPLLAGLFDFTQSLRVLVNLIENALKYSPPDTAVDVVACSEGDALVFRVSDRGPGIPQADLARIFTPFYRVAAGPPDVGGTGLGLAIASGLAAAQGGSLEYEPRPGGGSVFELRVPLASLESMGRD